MGSISFIMQNANFGIMSAGYVAVDDASTERVDSSSKYVRRAGMSPRDVFEYIAVS